MSNKIKGKYGEDTAVNYLIKNGYKILERNYHFSRYGEIDIIALDGGTLCFIEVKTRSSNRFGTPFESITKTKLDKIRKTAYFYMQNTPVNFTGFRIDAVSVFLAADGVETSPLINHIKNVEF